MCTTIPPSTVKGSQRAAFIEKNLNRTYLGINPAILRPLLFLHLLENIQITRSLGRFAILSSLNLNINCACLGLGSRTLVVILFPTQAFRLWHFIECIQMVKLRMELDNG